MQEFSPTYWSIGLEVLEVEEEEAVVVGDLEDEGEDAGLDVVEVEDAGEEERAHLGDGGADGVALWPKTSQRVTGVGRAGSRRGGGAGGGR